MLTIDRIREVVSRVGERYGIKSAYLFGSYAKGIATESSDVDLIIDSDTVLHRYKDYFHFCADLETELGTSVDVISNQALRPLARKHISSYRIPLYGV